jgi:hypothetical protein
MKERRTPDLDLETIIPILIGYWRRLHKLTGPQDSLQTREFRGVVDCIKALQEQYYNDKSLLGQNYFQNKDLLGAYLLYPWLIHYQEGMSLLGELPNVPKRVLDVCAGGSPFGFAALRHGAEEVISTDKNLNVLQAGAEICGRYGMTMSIREWDCLKSALPVEGEFDLIILAYGLNELFPPSNPHSKEHRKLFVGELLKRLTPNGHLLLVDDSHQESNKMILQLREHFVNEGYPVQAPCVWRGECPALKSEKNPCYAQRKLEKAYLIREFQRAAEINLGSLKMSYVILKNSTSEWPHLPPGELFRVISPPIDSYTGKRYYLCGTVGKRNLGSHLQEQPKESKAFDYLKRGELISIANALEKPNVLDIIEGTEVKVVAACGKPLPNKDVV